LLCFFFGTAICSSLLFFWLFFRPFSRVVFLLVSGVQVPFVEERLESVPAGVDVGLGARALAEVQVTPASGAQATAIGPTHRGERQLDADHVSHHLIRIQEPFGIQWIFVRILVGERNEELAQLDREPLFELFQAPSAPQGQGTLEPATREDAFRD
jgi:hypothetical protein